LAFAYRVLGNKEEKDKERIESGMIFLGLQGTIDAPRTGVKEAVEICKRAGIRVVMITGDNKVTAQAIAKEIDIGKKVPLLSTKRIQKVLRYRRSANGHRRIDLRGERPRR